jgi:uncharacterized membrane protein
LGFWYYTQYYLSYYNPGKGVFLKHKESLFSHAEGRILLFGLTLLGCFVLLILLSALFFPRSLHQLLSITATNIIFGRMAGLSIGIAAQMDTAILVAFNLFIESIMVLILYPLFVRSWHKLDIITYEPLERFMKSSRESAHKYQPLIKRYGAAGLILFVLTPFAMTGPVVGSFVGFLIGFSHKKTLFIVLSSTLAAIMLWVYLIKHFEALLVTYSSMINIGFLTAALLMLLWYLVKRYML